MNIEAELISYLTGLGYKAYAEVPAERPEQFVTIERTGGASDGYLDLPTIAVQAWSTTRYNASALALEIDKALMAFADNNNDVSEITRESLINYPDGKQDRYQAIYSLTTY